MAHYKTAGSGVCSTPSAPTGLVYSTSQDNLGANLEEGFLEFSIAPHDGLIWVRLLLVNNIPKSKLKTDTVSQLHRSPTKKQVNTRSSIVYTVRKLPTRSI
jgi:hypothetical protein